MAITSEMIKQLRDKTGAGMMDCKRALEASDGNMDAAIEHLRKKGAAVGQKRADRAAKEGMIVTRITENGKKGIIVEINCETDFVGRSEDFARFANTVADAIAGAEPDTLDDVLALDTNGKKVSELLNDLLAKVGEKVEIRRFDSFIASKGIESSYTHLGNKIGVLVELEGTGTDNTATTGRDVAMQIAAMNPMVIARDQIDKATIDREMDIYRTQASNEGKPAQIVDKIAQGRLEKFYQEVVLMEQTFIKDSGKTIKDVLGEASGSEAQPVSVRRFKRYHLGEETK